MRRLALGLVASLALLAAPQAKASLLLEPYLGYKLGNLKVTSSPAAAFSLSSAALGARVGYQFPILFIAADYNLLLGGSSTQDDSGSTKYDTSGNDLFLDVGASLPLIRAYLGYGLMNWVELKDSSGNKVKWEGGTAIKAGVGTTLMPIFAVNLEYTHQDYDKAGGISPSNSKSDYFMLNISFPFEF